MPPRFWGIPICGRPGRRLVPHLGRRPVLARCRTRPKASFAVHRTLGRLGLLGARHRPGLEAFCAAACGAFPNLYLVEYSHDGGRTWAARSGGWLRDGDAACCSSGPHLPYGGLGAVALNSAGAAVFSDLPSPTSNNVDDVQVGTVAARPAGTRLEMASAPALPVAPNKYALPSCHILGIAFVGRRGWLYFDDADVGTATHPLR